jgi:hypothetical protein
MFEWWESRCREYSHAERGFLHARRSWGFRHAPGAGIPARTPELGIPARTRSGDLRARVKSGSDLYTDGGDGVIAHTIPRCPGVVR